MQVPEIEIKSEKGFFLLSALMKGYKPEWGNQDEKCGLVNEARQYFEENPLDAETVGFLQSIKALEEGGIDEESLFVFSAMYGHPEREAEDLERYKEIDKPRAEELKSGLFGIFDKLDSQLASTKLAKDYEKAVEMIAGGMIKTKPLVTKHFPFAEYAKAYHFIEEQSDKTLKVMIDL